MLAIESCEVESHAGTGTATTQLTPDQIDRALRRLARRKAALYADQARWLRRGEQQNAWSKLGYVHALEYLEDVFGYGPRTAVEKLRVANELGKLPQLERALEAGELNYSIVRELTRVATPATVGRWLEAARGKKLREIERMVSGHRKGDDPNDAPDPKLIKHGVWLELDAESFALYRQARAMLDDEADEKLTDAEFIAAVARLLLVAADGSDASDGEGTGAAGARMGEVVEANARVGAASARIGEVVEANARVGAAGAPMGEVVEGNTRVGVGLGVGVGDGVSASAAPSAGAGAVVAARAGSAAVRGGRARPARMNHVTTCRDCKRGWQDGAGVRVELDAASVGRANCDAIIVDDERGERAHSRIPLKMRKSVIERDQHRCQVSGCGATRDLEVHEIDPSAPGGARKRSNLTTICGRHHKQSHAGTLSIRGTAPDALRVETGAPNIDVVETKVRTIAKEPASSKERASASHHASSGNYLPSRARKIPSTIYRLVMERAEHRCQVPGCRSARHLDVHHRKHRAHGGDHHPDNLIVLCSGHHRLYHEGLLLITGAPDALQFERVSVPTPPVASSDPITPHRRAMGPAMEDIADAQAALRQMGYKPAIAKRAVERACVHVGDACDLLSLIKEALKHCA